MPVKNLIWQLVTWTDCSESPLNMNRKKNHDHPESADHANGAPPEAAAPAQPAAAATATPPSPPSPSPLEAELAACKDRHLRLMADFDNFRKRQTREREETIRRSTEGLMQELLPVLDHLELALTNAPNKADPLATGVQMVADQFLATLSRFDLKPFQAAGERFDPTRHESVSELPSNEVPAQHVLHQLRCGYMLGGRLLRPAQVVISSGPAKPAAQEIPVCDATEEKEDA